MNNKVISENQMALYGKPVERIIEVVGASGLQHTFLCAALRARTIKNIALRVMVKKHHHDLIRSRRISRTRWLSPLAL